MTEPGVGDRAPDFRRNAELEAVLARLSDAIGPGGDALASEFRRPAFPVLLVVGCPRSGTTVTMQWLAASGAFAHPSNLISRFHRAPATGALVQRLLFDPDLDFRGELSLARTDAAGGYGSTLGKTVGPLAPNEFWYFWRRHFDFDHAADDDDPVGAGSPEAFLAELAAWESVARVPLAMKGLIAIRHLPELLDLLDRVIVLDVRRDADENVRSLLRSRVVHGGSEDAWYSFVPRGGDALRELPDPRMQVEGQVAGLRRDIERGVERLPHAQLVSVDLAEFLAAPGGTWDALTRAFASLGHELPPYTGPPTIPR